MTSGRSPPSTHSRRSATEYSGQTIVAGTSKRRHVAEPHRVGQHVLRRRDRVGIEAREPGLVEVADVGLLADLCPVGHRHLAVLGRQSGQQRLTVGTTGSRRRGRSGRPGRAARPAPAARCRCRSSGRPAAPGRGTHRSRRPRRRPGRRGERPTGRPPCLHARKGQGVHAMALCLEQRCDRVPRGCVQPGSRNQHDVHPMSLPAMLPRRVDPHRAHLHRKSGPDRPARPLTPTSPGATLDHLRPRWPWSEEADDEGRGRAHPRHRGIRTQQGRRRRSGRSPQEPRYAGC